MKIALLFLLALTGFVQGQAQQDSTTGFSTSVLSFQVQPVDKVVLLKWSIMQSEEFKAFDIERSENGSEFIKVGSKLAISKNSNSDYDFVDATPTRNVNLRYRLKLIYLNGAVDFSELKETKVAESAVAVQLKQNPVRNNIEIAITVQNANQASVAVISHAGQQMTTQTFRLAPGVNQFSLPAQSLLQGIYQLVVEVASERKIISFIKE